MVEGILGPNVLVWSSDFNIKEARSDRFFSWHQDSTYGTCPVVFAIILPIINCCIKTLPPTLTHAVFPAGLDPPEEVVTAWVALSPCRVDQGCMSFLPGSHTVLSTYPDPNDKELTLTLRSQLV